MTLVDLETIALGFAAHGWTRFWPDFRREPDAPGGLMAIQIYKTRFDPHAGICRMLPIRLTELEDRGFRLVDHAEFPFLYAIERTHGDGTPYRSPSDA